MNTSLFTVLRALLITVYFISFVGSSHADAWTGLTSDTPTTKVSSTSSVTNSIMLIKAKSKRGLQQKINPHSLDAASMSIAAAPAIIFTVGAPLKATISGAGIASFVSSITVSGGSPPYTYAWKNTSGTLSAVSDPAGEQPIFSAALASGQSINDNWTLTIKDDMNVSKSYNFVASFTSTGTATPVSISANPSTISANINGAGGASGGTTVSATGGSGIYNYSWVRSSGSISNISSATSNAPTFSATLTSGQSIAETWTVTAKDANNAAAYASANVNINFSSIALKPTISVTRSMAPLIAGQAYTTTWTTTNATSVSYACTASGTGFSGSATVSPVSGTSAANTAPASWVGYPSTCVWTATGVGGSTQLSEGFTTVNAAALSLSGCTTINPTTSPTPAKLRCTLSNTGGNAISSISYSSLVGMTISGPTGSCAANSICGTVTVTTGTAANTYSGTLSITPNTGTGTSTPVNLQVTKNAVLQFIGCSSNSPSNSPTPVVMTCTLTNSGLVNVTQISYSTLTGMTVTGPKGACDSGVDCGKVTITTNTTPGTYTGTLTATSTPNTGTNASVPVSLVVGNPLTPAALSLTNCATNSGTISPAAATTVCTLKNTGQTAIKTIAYGAMSNLSVSGPTGACAGNATCGSVTVTSVTTPGTYSGTLIVTADAGATTSTLISLTVLKPATLSFSACTPTTGTIAPAPANISCTLSNTGGVGIASLTYSSNIAGASIVGPTGACSANSTCGQVKLTTNTVANSYVGTLTATANTGITASTPVSLLVVTPATLVLSLCNSNTNTTSPTAATMICSVSNSGGASVSSIAYASSIVKTSISGWMGTCAGNSTCGQVTLTTDTVAGSYVGNLTATPNSGSSASVAFSLVVNPSVPKPTISISRSSNPLKSGQSYTTTIATTNATSVSYSCTAAGTGFNGTATYTGTTVNQTTAPNIAPTAWIGFPSTCTWTATGVGGSTQLVETMTTVDGTAPTVTLNASNIDIRVASGQSATVNFTGVGNQPSGQISKLELFKDSGTGYGTTAINTTTGNTASLNYSYNAPVTAGSYRFKLRATNLNNVTADSNDVIINVTDSSLLGEISGIRTNNNNGKLELVGWACQFGNVSPLNYSVYVNAPSVLGGQSIATGSANVASENSNTAIQTQCGTPSVGHHFVADLTNLATAYQGKQLFVEVATSGNTLKATLPCGDYSCTMPGAIRIGLTTPANNDRYTGPANVFMQAKIDNGSGTYDEVAFSINGQTVAATADSSKPGYYYATQANVPSSSLPYPISVKVRQGSTTVYSAENLIYVDALNTGVSVNMTNPTNNQSVPVNVAVNLTAYANILQTSTAQIAAVKFSLNGAFLANGINSGSGNWTATWTPAQTGSASIVATAYDANGTTLNFSPASQVTITDGSGPTDSTPIPVNVDISQFLTLPDAGTLPGSLTVASSGAATYNIALDVPPGTAGMQPKLSLDYSSQSQNGRVGLGWNLGGFSSIHRCGKTIAQDGVNGRIGFDGDDRLCLDGQRLVLVNGDTTNNSLYWAANAEFRTEIDSFMRITALGNLGVGNSGNRTYKVETKDGHISTYGGITSTVQAILGTPSSGVGAATPQPKNGAQSWALDNVVDRIGNYIRYSYEQDSVNGEHRPKAIRYGGNGLAPHAAVVFTYETRQDAWIRYIDETRNDLRSRLTHIKTYVGSDLSGDPTTSGTWVRDTTLTYMYSASSGRSLLSSIQASGRNPQTGLTETLPATTFHWGQPDASKAPGFESKGVWSGAPILTTSMPSGSSQYPGDNVNNHADFFAFSDFENHGFTDVLEKRISRPVTRPGYSTSQPGDPYPEGTLRNSYRYFHNKGDGTGFSAYTYRLNTNENFAVLNIGDFNGDGASDLLVATEAGVAKICLSPLNNSNGLGAPGSVIVFTCSANYPAVGKNINADLPFVVDIVGDGRSAHYGAMVYNSTNEVTTATQCVQGNCLVDQNPPLNVLGARDPSDPLDQRPAHDYISFEQMVDFSGRGKAENVRWTRPRFVWKICEMSDCNIVVNQWYNLTPQVVITGFNLVGSPSTTSLANYAYPTYPTPCLAVGCAPYGFDIPEPTAGIAADFNGSGYSGLFFGYFGKQNVNGIFQYQNPEAKLCLSTGRALDCSVRKKLSNDNYGSIRAVGNFVGDGTSTILVENITYSSTLPPQPNGSVKMCRLIGDDTTAGTSTNDDNLMCENWGGLNLSGVGPALSAADQIYFMDLLGTGRQQIVYYHSGSFDANNNWHQDGRWEVFAPVDRAKTGEALDRIVSVTNGLNATSTVEYVDGIPSGIVTRSAASNLLYPLRPSPNVGKVVSRLTHSNGVAQTRSSLYQYQDAAIDVSGRGSLGFAKFTVTDEQLGTTSISTFKQGFPFTGMVDTSMTKSSANVVLNTTTNTYSTKCIPQTSGCTLFVYTSGNSSQSNDLTGSDLGLSTTTNTYGDDWGNLTQQVTTIVGGGKTLISTTANTFRNDKPNWLIGLPLTSNLTKNDSLSTLGDQTRHVTRDYHATTGLPLWETIESGNQALSVTSTFDRSGNNFGLVSTKTESWFDPDTASARTRSTGSTYDTNGRFVSTISNALGQSESLSYEPGTGTRKKLTGPNGLSTLWEVNAFGRITVEKRADGNETRSYVKDCQGICPFGGNVVQISDQFNGSARTSVPQLGFSDNVGHVVGYQSFGFNGRVVYTDQTYDGLGRLQETSQAYFSGESRYLASTINAYDELGRVTSQQNYGSGGATQVTTTTYNGYVTTITNPLNQTRIETRNAQKQLVQVRDAIGGLTKFEYEPFGNLAKTIDPSNNVITVEYDLLGRKTALKDPDLGWIEYKVNPLGQTWAQISPKQRAANQKTRFVFDLLGRMTDRYETDLESHWTFDTAVKGIGQLAEAYTGPSNNKSYRRTHTYDGLGRASTVSQSLTDGMYTNTPTYDAWSRVVTQTYRRNSDATKVFDSRYNNMGYLARVERSSLKLWQVTTQDASNRVTQALLGNQLIQQRNYDPYSAHLSDATLKTASNYARLQEGYLYDSIGSVTNRSLYWTGQTAGFSETYTYDDLNRLSTAKVDSLPALKQTYTYDATGNILTKTNVSSGTYQYPAQGAMSIRPHAVQSIPGVGSFTYDDNGNLTSGANRTVSWTSFDMPNNITRGSDSSTFIYGPEHQRTRQINLDGDTVYAGAQEVETKGGIKTIRTYWPGGIGEEIDKGTDPTQLVWMHYDRLGSVVANTDKDGNLPFKFAFDSWGNRFLLDGSGTPDPKSLAGTIDHRGYTGHEMLDPLALVHMNGRVYDPMTARFLSADPILQDPMNGQSYNRFAYVLNNPTNLTDPTGFMSYSGEACEGRKVGCVSIQMSDGNLDGTSTAGKNQQSTKTSNGESKKNSNNDAKVDPKKGVAANSGTATGAAIAGAAWQAHEAASAKALTDAGYQVTNQVRVTWAGAEGSYAVLDAVGTKPVGEGLNIVLLEAKDGLTSKLSPAQKQLFKTAFSSGELMLENAGQAERLGLKAASSLAKQGALYVSVDASVMGSRSLGQFARIAAGSSRMGGFLNPSVIFGGLGRMLPSLAVFEILTHHQSTGGCDNSGKCSDMVDWSKRDTQKKE